jgi:nicotinate phosphoribosyltransferase
VRRQLDALGATETRIIVTNDLDEYAIAALGAMPVDAYGVGTALVSGSGHPAAGLVYKLVEHTDGAGAWRRVAKRSSQKAGQGGRKWAVRELDEDGRATAERVVICEEQPDPGNGRPLVVPLVVDGVQDPAHVGVPGVLAARDHHAAVIRELPLEGMRLSGGDPAIPTVFEDPQSRSVS